MTEQEGQPLRLAISGTYSTGKTTLSEALSLATGIPRVDALSAREILLDLVPTKQFQHLEARELLTLGLRRLVERVHGEAAALAHGSFISDGSVLNEWVYGEVRMTVGLNPGAPLLDRALKALSGVVAKPFMRRYLDAYGAVVKERAARTYTAFVHLPVEFEMRRDGHRPVSERYRQLSDQLLLRTLDELRIPYHIVRGSLEERIRRIVDIFELPLLLEPAEAIRRAHERIEASREMVAERWIATRERPSLLRRIRYALRY